MEDGSIKDNQITSLNWLYQSENFNAYYKAKFARLNNKKLGGGGWCSASIERFSGAYIEIDLLKNTKLTALATQGRGIGSEYIDEYGITYKREKDTKYREYRERGRWHVSSILPFVAASVDLKPVRPRRVFHLEIRNGHGSSI